MNRYLWVCLFLLLSVLSNNISALVVDNLYQTDVSVPSRSKEDLEKALPNALDQVATKVSGSPNIRITEQVRRSLPDITKLVQSYSYSTNGTQTILHVQFDNHAIDDLLNRVGKPIWSSDRPLTLIWIVNSASSAAILSHNPSDSLIASIESRAMSRGLPILWPEMDLQDINQIQSSDILNFNVSSIQKASQRYHPDTILIGKLTPLGSDNWQGQWLFISSNGQTTQWTNQDSDLNKVVDVAINKLGDIMMGRIRATDTVQSDSFQSPTSINSAKSTLTLKIINVDGLDDYSDVMKYVRNLSSVVSVEASQVDADFVLLTVTVNGGPEALNRDINLNQKLLPETNEIPERSDEIIYRWQSSGIQQITNNDDGVRL